MTDLHLQNTLDKQSAVVTQRKAAEHLAGFAQACAQCADALSNTPALEAYAAERLEGSLHGTVAISNPDIIFLNTTGPDGKLERSESLTRLFVQALAQGVPALDQSRQTLYSRHDSVDPRFKLADADIQKIQRAFSQVIGYFQPTYKGILEQAWNTIGTGTDGHRQPLPRHQLIREYHRNALLHNIELQALERWIDEADKRRLVQLIGEQTPTGLFKISLKPQGSTAAPLSSIYAAAKSGASSRAQDISGVFYLLMPTGGIEKFESFAALADAVLRQLAAPSSRKRLMQSMNLHDSTLLSGSRVIHGDEVLYEPCGEPLLECHLHALRHKQSADLDSLLQPGGKQGERYSAFLNTVRSVQVSAHVDESMGHHFGSLCRRVEQSAEPDWLKYADVSGRELYSRLSGLYKTREQTVDVLLTGLESLEVFANTEIVAYVQSRLGYSVDPANINLSVPDRFQLSEGQLTHRYSKSLLAFAVDGLPHASGAITVKLPKGSANPAFDSAFVEQMIDSLDLHRRYSQQLRARYTEENTHRAMTLMRDSAMALTACSAELQGHLRDGRSQELLHLVRGDNTKGGSTLSMGSLTLAASGAYFKDVLVFMDRTGADDHYVLYAPGAPGGQDMFEFSSWRSLSFVIGGWLATEGGARYIKDQTATTLSGDEHGFLEKVQAKPTLWSGSSVVFTELAGQNFEETLGRSVQQKVDRVLGVQEMTLTRFQHQTAYATPRSYALLTARIEALNQAFGTTTQHLVLFEEFARREANTAIAAYLKAEGSDTLIDADTLYFDLENATYTGSPDFSEYTRLRSVTRLYMESYSNSYAYKPSAPMYSSVGQNLAGLPTKFVKFIDKMLRDANAGSRYIDFLKDEFLNVKHPAYAYRKGLFGKRLHCDMRQAAMRDLFNGHLSERQYQWLVQMITSLDKTLFDQSKSLREVLKRSTVSHFRFAGHVVEGVYLFRDFSKPVEAFNLLYTPDAPDGISFRAVTDYPQLMSAGSMRGYYYRRVAYKAQPSVGSRFDDMDRNIAVSIEIENRETQNTDQITDVDRLYDRQIQCLITDVDDQTQSTHERWIENCYSVARKVGWLLLIPFPAASLAWTGFNLALDVQRGLSAYHYGDRAAASGFLADSIFGAISGGLGVQGLTAAAGEGVTSLIKVWVGKKIVRAVFQ